MKFVDELIDNPVDGSKVAIIQGGHSISYEELKNKVYFLYNALINEGIKRPERVIVCLEKSIESIVTFFAIMKCGATFIPLDTEMPKERMDYIIQNSKAGFIITTTKLQALFSLEDCKILISESLMEKNILPSTSAISRNLDDVAYIIYTSGSTGNPKGVMISHRSFSAFVDSISEMIPYYEEKIRYLSLFPFYFDASLCDIYPTLKMGGTLILMEKFMFPNQLLDALEKHMITIACMPSTLLKLLVSRFSSIEKYSLPNLQAIWYGTESCPISVVKRLKELLPNVQFVHSYGPTEATCTSHVYFDYGDEDKYEEAGVLPIGKPLPTIESYIYDEKLKPVKPGSIGELYIGGTQVMVGYCGEEAKTQQVLIERNGKKIYKTGDYVKEDEEGNCIFMGRKDDMIKYSGKLIYLSEIEDKLLKVDGISDATIITHENSLGVLNMYAFLIEGDTAKINIEGIRCELSKKLPQYMIPHKFVCYNENTFPQMPSGKTDKKFLESLIEKGGVDYL